MLEIVSRGIFYRQKDGSYISNLTEYEKLSYNDALTEYRKSKTDGTVYVFTSGGLLSLVEEIMVSIKHRLWEMKIEQNIA